MFDYRIGPCRLYCCNLRCPS
ncbi:UNVERIFIED_CONTAM: hypothetical protein GTU68_001697 [Idotea baltica]|nr:hypothetical protein [Idotea baltica]